MNIIVPINSKVLIDKINLICKIEGIQTYSGYAKKCILKDIARYDFDVDFAKALKDEYCDDDII